MRKFGLTYQVTDFISKLIPRKRIGDVHSVEFTYSVLEFLRQLDQIQETNPRITMSFHANDGLWVYCDGSSQLFLKPTQKFLLLHVFEKNKSYDAISLAKEIFTHRRTVEYAAGLWEIRNPELEWLLKYFQESWRPSGLSQLNEPTLHPRHIPGDVRQYVLTQFINGGRICMGVKDQTEKHKVGNAQIEFDHILPYSEGGANTDWNVQILCLKCNRVKRATAK